MLQNEPQPGGDFMYRQCLLHQLLSKNVCLCHSSVVSWVVFLTPELCACCVCLLCPPHVLIGQGPQGSDLHGQVQGPQEP